jgi:hypothetical protein
VQHRGARPTDQRTSRTHDCASRSGCRADERTRRGANQSARGRASAHHGTGCFEWRAGWRRRPVSNLHRHDQRSTA